MTRLIGPDEGSREVKSISGGVFRAVRNKPVTMYVDTVGSILADILTLNGVEIAGSVVTTNAYSMLPLFQFPDGVDVIYGSVEGGPVWPIYARTDDRIDSLDGRVTSIEGALVPASDPRFTVDAAANVGSVRTLGTGSQQAAPGNDTRFGVESQPISAGLSWTGVVDLTTLAAAARTMRATLTGNVTLALPTPSPSASYTVTLLLTQDATGSRTLTLPAAALSSFGVDPVLSTTAGATDLVHLLWTGAAWIALLGAPAVA